MAFENLKSTGIKYLLEKLKGVFLQIKDAVKSVNGNEPDENGDIHIESVPYADNLQSELTQRSVAEYIDRTAGGDASISNGDAWLMDIKGNSVHDGYVPESINMTVSATGEEDPITAELDRDTFVSYVDESGTITLIYTSDWSADPALYGITVTGIPASGDSITIVYVKEVRGTITVADPRKLIATGWNLYNHSTGYARALKYSEDYGFRIEGTYTAVQFSSTITGTKGAVTVTDGNFDIPSDGYIWVTGGNSTDTAVYMTWSDWTEEAGEEFTSYSETEVDFSSVMTTYFPNGLLKAGSVRDEINFNLGQAINKVERKVYSDANRAAAEASGREYEFDEDYIYLALSSAVTNSISVDGGVTVHDHGLEMFTNTDVPVIAEMIYGNNLKNKLERDVLTKSADLVDNLTTNDSTKVLSAAQGYALNSNINNKTLTQTGLTIDSTFDSAGGGYCRIGQFVLIQIRLNKLAPYSFSAGSTIVSGFPPALDSPVYLTPSANISNGELYIDTSGNLKNQNEISADRTIFASGFYLAST